MHPNVYCSIIYNSQDMEQLKYPLTYEWVKKMWCINIDNGLLLGHKKETMPFAATWIDLEIIILREISQAEKNNYHMISLNKKLYKWTFFYKTKTDSQT